MTTPALPRSAVRHRRAFSLVEVTLALGIVTFALVGVVGVLPTAMSAGRRSFDQNRAAAVANTLFASIRSQPFFSVAYLDEQLASDGTRSPTNTATNLDLNQRGDPAGSGDPVTLYASFIESAGDAGVSGDDFGAQRRLCFTRTNPGVGTAYQVTMRFNRQPEGMVVAPVAGAAGSPPTVPGQANQIEMTVAAVSRPADQYRFVSTVANRL